MGCPSPYPATSTVNVAGINIFTNIPISDDTYSTYISSYIKKQTI
jgi:hypothetical protein